MTMQSGPERVGFIHSVAGQMTLMGIFNRRNSASCLALRVLMHLAEYWRPSLTCE